MKIQTRVPVLIAGAAALLGLSSASVSSLRAQDASITGRILSTMTGDPVAGAEVRLRETEHRMMTSGSGLFRFSELEAGQYELVIHYLGNESKIFPIHLAHNQSLALQFDLKMTVVPIPELVVTVSDRSPVGKLYGFYRRAENSPGHFITREEIAESHAPRTSDILRRVPGLDVTARPGFDRTPITMGRRKGCVPEFYVDGARAPYFNVDNLQPVDIAGIEVYRGNSEVPVEFKHEDRCGVIVLWTRDPSNWRGFQ